MRQGEFYIRMGCRKCSCAGPSSCCFAWPGPHVRKGAGSCKVFAALLILVLELSPYGLGQVPVPGNSPVRRWPGPCRLGLGWRCVVAGALAGANGACGEEVRSPRQSSSLPCRFGLLPDRLLRHYMHALEARACGFGHQTRRA